MEADHGAAPEKHEKAPEDVEFVKLNNQFVVPVVESGRGPGTSQLTTDKV